MLRMAAGMLPWKNDSGKTPHCSTEQLCGTQHLPALAYFNSRNQNPDPHSLPCHAPEVQGVASVAVELQVQRQQPPLLGEPHLHTHASK